MIENKAMSFSIPVTPVATIAQYLTFEKAQFTPELARSAVQDCVQGYLADRCGFAGESGVLLYGDHCFRALQHTLKQIRVNDAMRETFSASGKEIILTDFFAGYTDPFIREGASPDAAAFDMLNSALLAYDKLMDTFASQGFRGAGYNVGDEANLIFTSAARMLPPSLRDLEGKYGLPVVQTKERDFRPEVPTAVEKFMIGCSKPHTIERVEARERHYRQLSETLRQSLVEEGLTPDAITTDQVRDVLEMRLCDGAIVDAISVYAVRPEMIKYDLIPESTTYVELAALIKQQPELLEQLSSLQMQEDLKNDPMAGASLSWTQDGIFLVTPYGTFKLNGNEEPGSGSELN